MIGTAIHLIMASAFIVALVGLAQLLGSAEAGIISVSSVAPSANLTLPEGFVSYSIEFSSFPDFAGNLSAPNHFSDNLLHNIEHYQGTKPYIRVGGNTQDYYLYNASLPYGLNGTVNPARSPDYPTTIYIGPSFFESFQTWADVQFVYGFNLGLGGNNSVGWESLLEVASLACKALTGKLLYWEYGNEPDLYSTSSQGPVRPPSWNETTYVHQWLNGTRAINSQVAQSCPGMDNPGYIAPSFAGTNNHLKAYKTFANGITQDGDIKLISSHNYIGGATQPGVTLQGTLMNHTTTVTSVNAQFAEAKNLSSYGIPFILGETNSLYNQGAPGLSNSFGAALWGIDFNLYSASTGIRRVHMHQGTNYRYAAWQPITTNLSSIGTKAPYYGSVAVAAFLSALNRYSITVSNLPLPSSAEAAYAAYENGHIARLMVVNMREYNYTENGSSTVPNPVPRPVRTYSFSLPRDIGWASVERLMANGSDAVSGITWNGISYNYELDRGRPVVQKNVTTGEKVYVNNGTLSVTVPDSSAVLLKVYH